MSVNDFLISDYTSILVIGGIIIYGAYIIYKAIVAAGFLPQLGRHDSDGPIISSKGMLEARGLDSLHKQTLGKLTIHFLLNSAGRVMVFVELGRNTNMHLVAIGDKSGVSSQVRHVPDKFLTEVQLEGDFPSYFKMYCTPAKQVELRQVFEPVTMAQFADFCRAYDFEIYHDSLYISQAENSRHKEDTTTMVTDILKFLENHQKLLNRI